jgi:hypothetical protein
VADPSTFAQRFEFARDRQRALGTWREDQELARQVGVAASRIVEYKARSEAPGASRTLALARVMAVDPGWLAFGEASQAPAPGGFDTWIRNRAARDPFAGGFAVPTLERESFEEEEPPTRATGTSGRPGAKKRR